MHRYYLHGFLTNFIYVQKGSLSHAIYEGNERISLNDYMVGHCVSNRQNFSEILLQMNK